MDDDAFVPRLGRMRAGGGKKARRYLSRVLAASARAASPSAGKKRRFDGSRIGRGAGIGRIVSSRSKTSRSRQRRVVVKTRLVRLGPKGLAGTRAHLRYIQRDGVTRNGDPGELYSGSDDRADGAAFLERGRGDRHQFRFIVSAEDGDQYDDLKPLTRRLLAQMEKDLGTKLDWVAVDHFNTGHPHTHIMLRGVDDRGANLIIAREYIAHGIRGRASELVSLDLGSRTEQEIQAQLHREVDAERLTSIDRQLLRAMDDGRLVAPAHRDPRQQVLRVGRLNTLTRLGLAHPVGRGHWQLVEQLEDRLRELGERGDIIRTMQRELSRLRLVRDSSFGKDVESRPLIGRVVARGLSDEHRDRHYVIVDGIDGRAHYFDIGASDTTHAVAVGATVRISGVQPGTRPADRTIAEIATTHDGLYSPTMHREHDPAASGEFIAAHVRRLEALRRSELAITRVGNGVWEVPTNFLEQVRDLETKSIWEGPITVDLISPVAMPDLVRLPAVTWLDRMLADKDPTGYRDMGFGREVGDALNARRQWLVRQGFATRDATGFRMSHDALANLESHEIRARAALLSSELGKAFAPTDVGSYVEGRLTRQIEMGSGSFALIERSHEFSLVPWRPVLERQIGREIGGIVRASGISWTFSHRKGGIAMPEI